MMSASKTLAILLAVIMLMSNFAGAMPAIVENNVQTVSTDRMVLADGTDGETKLKLMHRSIDYAGGASPETSIVPAYESQDNGPSAADTDFYLSTYPTHEIRQSAEKNLHDPAVIYSFVHNYFEYVPYFGSLKGAHLTYMDREGNDADQAALTISLLRASDIPARYVYGTIKLDTEQAKNYFGVENESVIVDMLHKNGISAGEVSKGVQFDHVWVEAYVNGTWVELDPSFKQYTYTEGLDLEALALDSSNYSSMLEENVESSEDEITDINVSGLDSSFTLMADEFRTLLNTEYANTTNSEIFGLKNIVPYTDYYTLPQALPYTVVRVHGEYADLPDTFNHKLRIQLSGIDITLNTAEVAEKRVSVFYEPSTGEDADYFNSSASLSELDALKLNMSALLSVDGAVKAIGTPESLGSEQELELSFIAPGGQVDSYTRNLRTGAYFVIGLALQPVSTAHMNERVRRYEVTNELLDLDYFNVTKEELYGELLNLQALTFWGNYGLYNSIAAEATEVVYTRHPSAMLVGTEFDVSENESSRSVRMNGVYTDIVRDVINPTAKDGDSAKSYAFLFTRGMTASSMEKSMLSLSYDVTSYSTSEIIKMVGDADIPIYTLDSSNWGDREASLNISDSQKAIVKSAVDSGYSVTIPRDNVTVGNFTGSVFIVFDPETGASSYYGPNGRGWGWLDTLKTGLEAAVSAAGTVVKGTASIIAETGGKIAGVATGVISTIGEAVNGTGSTVARVAKTVLVGTVNAAGYVITGAAGAVAGATAGAVAGVVIVTAFTGDRLTELGKAAIDIYDAKVSYEESEKEYKETQEKIKEKKKQITKEELEQKKEELENKKKELEQKKEELEQNEDIDITKDKKDDGKKDDGKEDDEEDDEEDDDEEDDDEKDDDDEDDDEEDDDEDDEEEDDEDDFPGDDEEAEEPDLKEDLDLDKLLDPEDDPEEPSSPGGDHPDDTFSVASSKLRDADVTSLLIRNAYKKDYTNAVHLNEYRIGQAEIKSLNDYTNSSDRDRLYELSASQAGIYTNLVKNYDTIEEELGIAPNVLILKKGFYASAKAMLEETNVPVSLIRVQDFVAADSQKILHDTPILFLPSGSLYGLDSSELVKQKLAEYTAAGGTIVVMAQQHGYEFNMLPYEGTRALSGAGWQEDQSCLYNAASISEYHPVVSGQPRSTLTVNIDGYFTSYPENSTIILKRNKNSMPAMLLYSYGEGRVLATSVYDDWAYLDGASTRQGELLVRDILTWAENPDVVENVLETDKINLWRHYGVGNVEFGKPIFD